ncbi:MAG: polymer-forming cytoskeletal protein [Phycisphaerales bacterium]
MTKSSAAAHRPVQCYHCRHRFDVAVKTMTSSCPKCSKALLVQDVVVKGIEACRKLQTCGRIVIEKKGRVMAQLVEAHEGIEVQGVIETKAYAGGPVSLGARAEWKGDCRAPRLEIEPGAKILGGFFVIPDDSLGLSDLLKGTEPAVKKKR